MSSEDDPVPGISRDELIAMAKRGEVIRWLPSGVTERLVYTPDGTVLAKSLVTGRAHPLIRGIFLCEPVSNEEASQIAATARLRPAPDRRRSLDPTDLRTLRGIRGVKSRRQSGE